MLAPLLPAVIVLTLFAATPMPAHAAYIEVFLGSPPGEYQIPADFDWVRTRLTETVISPGTPGSVDYGHAILHTESLGSGDNAALERGEVAVGLFGPLLAGKDYTLIVELWKDVGTLGDPSDDVVVDWGLSGVRAGTYGLQHVMWLPGVGFANPLFPPNLIVSKTDQLAVDVDGDGMPTVGDQIDYDVTVWNQEEFTAYANVGYDESVNAIFQGQIPILSPPPTMSIDGGPPTTSGVTLAPGNGPFDFTNVVLDADIGTLDPGVAAVIEYSVVLGQLGTLSRGYAGADDHLALVPSDDPAQGGDEDPTLVSMSLTGPQQCRTTLPYAQSMASDDDGDGVIRFDELAAGTDPDLSDSDGDGLDDGAELLGPDGVEGTGDETDPLDLDTDLDNSFDGSDNCPLVPNPGQADGDGDGVGDVCDNCPGVINVAQADDDGDRVGDACDLCPETYDPANLDRGGFGSSGPDGVGDACQTADFDLDGDADADDVAILRNALAEVSAPPAPGMPPTGCAAGVAGDAFGPSMFGCRGTVAWTDRATLCAPGWAVCSAAEWVGRRAGLTPGAHYWTEDQLLRNDPGGGLCYAHESQGDPADCSPGEWMHVCAGEFDDLGNTCGFFDCGYQTSTPNEYFGGCSGADVSAGTLCCR